MSSTEVIEPKTEYLQHDVQHTEDSHGYDLDDKAKISDYKADAIEAENAEHNMTVLEAVRAYPAAAFWAFVMSSTIVSCPFSPVLVYSFPSPTRNRG